MKFSRAVPMASIQVLLVLSGEAPLPDALPPLKEAVAIPWTKEALVKLENVPPFVRSMARNAIEDYAQRHGYTEITPEVMTEAREKMGM